MPTQWSGRLPSIGSDWNRCRCYRLLEVSDLTDLGFCGSAPRGQAAGYHGALDRPDLKAPVPMVPGSWTDAPPQITAILSAPELLRTGDKCRDMHSEALLFGFDFEAARAIVRALDGCCLELYQMNRTKRPGVRASTGRATGITGCSSSYAVQGFPATFTGA